MRTQLNGLRTLHFIDIENLGESAMLTEQLVRTVKFEYMEAVKPRSEDQYLIGVSHFNLAATSFGWGSGVAKYLIQSGENGADLALLEYLSDPQVTGSFQGVKIASGDGIFSEMGAALRRKGFKVGFVARQYGVSGSIYRSGCDCLILPSSRIGAEEYQLVS